MADTQQHKNVAITHVGHRDVPYYHVIDKEGTLREYKAKDWDMEVTFTRRIPPFPDGTLALDGKDNSLFHKIKGKWYYIYLEDEYDGWTEYSYVTDEMVRNNTDKFKVLHEPESD